MSFANPALGLGQGIRWLVVPTLSLKRPRVCLFGQALEIGAPYSAPTSLDFGDKDDERSFL